MAKVINMPRLSDTMTEGVINKWNKKVGDNVKEGDVIAEIESDKANMEFESIEDGTLLYIGVKEGQSAKIDSTIAIIGDKNEDISKLLDDINSKEVTNNGKTNQVKEEKEAIEDNISQDNADLDIKQTESNDRVKISPLAKKIVKDKNINPSSIKGSGYNGRIVKRDIEDLSPQVASYTKLQGSYSIDVTPTRKTIANRLCQSMFSVPHYYLSIDINANNIINLKNTLSTKVKISINDIITKVVALALRKNPNINSSWGGDKIIIHNNINIGIAIGLDSGLVVLVVKDVDNKSLEDISTEIKMLSKKAQDKKIEAKDMEDSTFCISNLGMFGISEFTSIINLPNSAILSVGTTTKKPIIDDNDNIVVSSVMKMTLGCDHRVIDGAVAARFLKSIKDFIENPISIIVV